MASPSLKRSLPPSKSSPAKSRKRARVEPKDEEVVIIEDDDDDDDDDLAEILAQIKASEENEKRARTGSSSKNTEVIDVDDIEDDAAMARRLAAEWADEEPAIADTKKPESVDVDAWEPPVAITSVKTGPARPISPADNIPPDEKLAEFRSFFTAERDCSNCGKPVKCPRGFVVFSAASGAGTLPPSLTMLLHAPCSSCGTNHCRGCFLPLDCPKSCKGTSKNANCTVATCCPAVRALAIFECLGGFDRQFLGERATSESRALALAQKHQAKGASVGPGGTGYGMDGRGYGAAEYSGYRGRGRGRGRGGKNGSAAKMVELANHWDEIVVRALQMLTSILPSPYAESAQVYDMLPNASIGHLLSLSQLPELLGSLLRNDSVTDWIARSEIYEAMIALLRRMADCELTVEVLIAQRFCMDKSSGLEEWMWEDGEISWEKDKQGRIERAPPLYDHFKKLTKQCEAFLAGAMQMMQDGEGDDEDDSVKAMSLCGDIIAAGGDMERAMSILNRGSQDSESTKGKGKGKNRDPAIDMEREYSQACETWSFKHVELDYSRYHYHQQLEATASATRTPKNRLHLVKELAMMATSLPPGIWVRVDEVRNDVIQIMIAGPDDTPYSGGLFEFDCFMPLTYPATPPLMHLRTTGGGSVRFNPNLYNCGKVCLSLLGTWPGRPEEQWSSSSTLLQVLVSIQSMILIDAPYYNEPGHGKANPNSQVSINYNKEISQQTCRWAMIDWLRDEHKTGIWKVCFEILDSRLLLFGY
ncbi:hypothetical protein C8R47DRAFT_529564 [Mycena vitilis]|nr:hypothetical protein C8R47DRAFT_529564 [Mycena vitilis]